MCHPPCGGCGLKYYQEMLLDTLNDVTLHAEGKYGDRFHQAGTIKLDRFSETYRPTTPNGNHNRETFFLALEFALRSFCPDKGIL